MAIEPINGVSMRPDLTALRRQNQAVYPGDAPNDAAGGAPNNAPATAAAAAGQRLPPQVLQMMQRGRETSALLSTLPGPNLGFFQPPAPPPGFTATGQTAGGLPGPQPRINAPLFEMEQQGRVTSALLSPLMGPNMMDQNMMGQNERVFPAPTPPAFAAANATGQAANPAGVMASAAGPNPGGPQAIAAGGAPGSAPLPRAGAQLLETEQTGRETSALLSGLMGSTRGPSVGFAAGDPQAAMRTAQEVIQAVGSAAPSALNTRIANEAYQMEAQAQQQYTQKAVNGGGNWEWFA